MDNYDIKRHIRDIKDFPKEGVVFRDITTLIKDPEGLRKAVDGITDKIKDFDFDYIVSPESRGFIFGMPVAYNLHKGFIPIRKPGKLPADTISEDYTLEYGTNSLEIHNDALKKGDRVVVIDDLMATGGTMRAMINLIEKLGAEVVDVVCVIDLDWLKGKECISEYKYDCLAVYETE